MPKLGIRAYLLIALGTLSAVPTLVLATVTASRASASELERADRDSRARANAVARELDEFIVTQTASVELLAGHVSALGMDFPDLQSVVTTHRRHSPQLSFAYIADRDGVSLVTDPPFDSDGVPNAKTSYRDRDYYKELLATGRTTISGVQRGRRSGVPNVQVVAPIHDRAGTMTGFAEGSIDLHALSDSIGHAIRGFRDSRVIVTDGHGRILADSSNRLAVLGDVSQLPMLDASPAATDVGSTRDERGTRVRVATARMKRTLGWTVTAIREQSSVDAVANAARRDALVVTTGAILIALLVVALGVHWLSKPIRALAATTKAMGRGDFSKLGPPARVFEAQEIAELLVSVRDMASHLQQQRDETTGLITELEGVNDQLRTMVVGIEHAGNAIEVADANGLLTYVNPAWERFTGLTAGAAIGTSFITTLSMDRTFVVDVWAHLIEGTPWRGIYPCRRTDGSLFEVELNAIPVIRSDGELSHIVASRIDISEQRRAEELLRMNDRLAAVGTLAAGVAHEINNPLTYISANLEGLEATVAGLEATMPASDYAEAMQSFRDTQLGVERVTNIVRDLKQLSRPDERTTTAVDINQLLDSCVRMGNLETRHRATVECDYGELSPIAGNEARLSQVFLNLLINAAQACSAETKATNVIRVVSRCSPDRSQVIVEISDTGAGIEPQDIEHIFDAFFTTKPIGVGTGLGLSICHGIVKQLGGTITVDSARGRGSTFRVTLPTTLAAPAVVAPVAQPALARVKILIVDDERGLATALARMLRAHDVTVSEQPLEALTLLTEQIFDVIVTDMMMPDLNGFELYRRACEIRPEYARSFVFMTGGVQADLLDALDQLRLPCLYKPFTLRAVLSAVAAVIAPPESTPPPGSENDAVAGSPTRSTAG